MGRTALHYAIDLDNAEIVDFLLKKGADPNKEDNSGHTPKEESDSCGDDIARLLKKYGKQTKKDN